MGEIQGKFTVFRPLWRNSYSFPVCISLVPLYCGTEQNRRDMFLLSQL